MADGRAVQIRGNDDHPYSAGELCPKVNRFLDVSRRAGAGAAAAGVGAKGEGRFEPITWSEALGVIAGRFHDAAERHGAESIVPYSDAGNQSLLATAFPTGSGTR